MHLRSARVIGLLFAFLSVFLLFRVSVANAQSVSSSTQTYTATPQNSSVSPDVPRNQHTHVQITLIEIMSALGCNLIGIDAVNPKAACLGFNPQTEKIGYAPSPLAQREKPQLGGLAGGMSGLIGNMYAYPPASSIDYFQHMAGNFGFQKAHAQEQGYGFGALEPFRRVYELTRNIAYLLFALFLVVIGVAIMLRVKIDPRTVMTVQNQIPKIIIGLLMITFSYSIAGFLVDVMWTLTYVSVNTLVPISGATVTDRATRGLTKNPIEYLGDVIPSNKNADATDLAGRAEGNLHLILGAGGSAGDIVSAVILTSLGMNDWQTKACDPVKEPVGCGQRFIHVFLQTIFTGIVTIIIAIAVIIVLFRIWFMLLKAYAIIVLGVMSAPLWIAAGLLPNSKINFGGWFRQITANLLVFPATVCMFILAGIVSQAFDDTDQNSQWFLPPLVGQTEVGTSIGSLIALGILLMTPDLLNMLRDALKSPPSQYGGNLRSRFMAGNPLSAAPGLGQFGYTMHNIKNAPVVGGFFKHFSGEGKA